MDEGDILMETQFHLIQSHEKRDLSFFKVHRDLRFPQHQVAACIRWGTTNQWHVFLLETLGM
jgi:hypothetical protein